MTDEERSDVEDAAAGAAEGAVEGAEEATETDDDQAVEDGGEGSGDQ